jgi:hypothetical protein
MAKPVREVPGRGLPANQHRKTAAKISSKQIRLPLDELVCGKSTIESVQTQWLLESTQHWQKEIVRDTRQVCL